MFSRRKSLGRHYKNKKNICMQNIKSIDFSVVGVITVTFADGTTQVFSTAPVVSEDKSVTVTHADGSSETFAPVATA